MFTRKPGFGPTSKYAIIDSKDVEMIVIICPKPRSSSFSIDIATAFVNFLVFKSPSLYLYMHDFMYIEIKINIYTVYTSYVHADAQAPAKPLTPNGTKVTIFHPSSGAWMWRRVLSIQTVKFHESVWRLEILALNPTIGAEWMLHCLPRSFHAWKMSCTLAECGWTFVW